MEYRSLSREEITKLIQIDRTESVDHIYYMRNGTLTLEEEHWDVSDWSPSDKQRRIAGLQALYDEGATFFGALDGSILAGMSVLEHRPVRSGIARLNLAGMWVGCQYRGKGVGQTLFGFAADEARRRGAKALYVSATPSERTIRFYTSLGCQLTTLIDPHLYALEPEDIHLELSLADRCHE